MDAKNNAPRQALAEQAEEVLNRYTGFSSKYQVSFSLAQPTEEGLPRITGRLERSDGAPIAGSDDPMDQKFAHLKDQTIAIRPFYYPMMKAEFDETEANEFTAVDFDYAAIIGYRKDEEGNYYIKSLYFPPTDALLDRQQPGEDGVWRKLPLATFNSHQLSLDPRQKFARFLYLAERMSEALEYQYDKCGFFFSNP